MVGGSGVAFELVSAGAAFFLGGMVAVELVRVVVGWAVAVMSILGTMNRVLNNHRVYTESTQVVRVRLNADTTRPRPPISDSVSCCDFVEPSHRTGKAG